MSGALLVASRELRALAASGIAWVVASLTLLVEGMYFYAVGIGGPGGARSSADVLVRFFDAASAGAIAVALVLGMRSIARERERGTMVLLATAPITDGAVVTGKFLAALVVVLAIQAVSLYMPALVMVHGRVALAHVAIGYLGVGALGAAALAIAMLASALARTQAVAGALGGAAIGALLLAWILARALDPPWSEAARALALHHTHQRPFMRGELRLEDLAYYVGLTLTCLVAASKALGARRWR